MTREENVLYAKRNLVDTIYKSAKLEGLAVTFPQTEAIIYGGQLAGLRTEEVVVINNLKHAWNFLFDNLDYPLDYAFLCKLHHLVGSNLILEPGFLRTGEVFIGGIDPDVWKPEIPDEEKLKFEIKKMGYINDPIDRAVDTMLFSMRTQPFWDGNKRVSMLAANHILISHGCGILSVPESGMIEFKKLLIDFCITGDKTPLKQFVLDRCVHGVDLSKNRENKDRKLPELNLEIAKAEYERDKKYFEKLFATDNLDKLSSKDNSSPKR